MRLFSLLFLFCFSCGPVFAVEPDLLLPLNRSEIITDFADVTSVGSDDISVAKALVHGKGRVSITARSVGQAYISLMSSQGKLLKRFLVKVTEDLPGVRRSIRLMFPSEVGVQVDIINENVILSGYVSGIDVANRIEKVAGTFLKSQDSRVLNLLEVNSTHQVTLMVKVGELRKQELSKIGLRFNVGKSPGAVAPGFYADSNPGAGGLYSTIFKVATEFSSGNLLMAHLDLLEREGTFKVLASPVLTALSGENAKFMAGGELPMLAMNGKMEGVAGIDYKPFGVMVDFTPMVVDGDTIRLKVSQEVSELGKNQAVSYGGHWLPSISTRRASTTVDLSPGESLMIAGLVKKSFDGEIDDVPGLGKIPILGALFRSVSFAKGETELVIAVTPYLSNPMRGSDIRLPGMCTKSSGIIDSFFMGRLNGSDDLSLEGSVGYILD